PPPPRPDHPGVGPHDPRRPRQSAPARHVGDPLAVPPGPGPVDPRVPVGRGVATRRRRTLAPPGPPHRPRPHHRGPDPRSRGLPRRRRPRPRRLDAHRPRRRPILAWHRGPPQGRPPPSPPRPRPRRTPPLPGRGPPRVHARVALAEHRLIWQPGT